MDKIEIVSQTENKKEEIFNPFYSSSTLNLIQTTPLMKNDNIDTSAESNTEEESKEFAHFDDFSEEIQLRVLPLIPREQLFERDFSLRQPTNIEVTSVDVASHGCFVICGCSNGQILLFDLSQPNPSTSMAKSTTSVAFQQPQLIGHIKAKGIHTNLLLTVVITEDCRFCFAGVLKGSSELLAIDLGRLPVDPIHRGRKTVGPVDTRNYSYADTITFIHSDPKLRGFGAAALVTSSISDYERHPRYRLACGRGIKNVHVWQFSPARSAHNLPNSERLGEDGTAFSPFQCSSDGWVCMYDVATNGNTITGFAFRYGATELLTKSGGSNLRVWNLRSFDPSDADKSSRPPYEDIANTQDTKNIVPSYAFGGTYEFAIVRIDAPKEANRDAFYMPEKVCEEDNGLRRRRTMREVESILSTQDGSHILILCTDGCVMYYPNLIPLVTTESSAFALQCTGLPNKKYINVNNSPSDGIDVSEHSKPRSESGHDSEESEESDHHPAASAAKLQELTSLHRDTESDQAWSLKRVGREGDVVLARAYRTKASVCRLSINLLSCETKGDVKDTSVPPDYNWNTCGYYFDGSGEKEREEEKVGNVDFGIATAVSSLENDQLQRPKKRERESEKPRGRPPRPQLKTARPDPAQSVNGSIGNGRGLNASNNAFQTPECDLNSGAVSTVDADTNSDMKSSPTLLNLATPTSQSNDMLLKVNLSLDLRTTPSPNILHGGTDSPLIAIGNSNSNPKQQPKKRVIGVKPRSNKQSNFSDEVLNSDEEKEKDEPSADKKLLENDGIQSTRLQTSSHSTKKASLPTANCLASRKGQPASDSMDDNNVVSKNQPFQQPLQLLVPPPKVLRVVNSSDVHTIIAGNSSTASDSRNYVKNIFTLWVTKLNSIVPDEIVAGIGENKEPLAVGYQVQRCLSLQMVEQDRLKLQFLSRAEEFLLQISKESSTCYPIVLSTLHQHLHDIVTWMIQRQQLELDTAVAMDQFFPGNSTPGIHLDLHRNHVIPHRKEETRISVLFRHKYMFLELNNLQIQLNTARHVQ